MAFKNVGTFDLEKQPHGRQRKGEMRRFLTWMLRALLPEVLF